MTSITPPSDTPVLFEFLRLLAIAQARGVMTPKRAAVAMMIALDSRGTTGEDARVDDSQIVLELGVSRPTVWRHVRGLIDSGWLVRVSAAIGGSRGRPGTRAVYRLVIPELTLWTTELPPVDSDPVVSQAAGADETRRRPEDPGVVSQAERENETSPPVDNRSRVSFRGESCLTATPDGETLPPSTHLRMSMADVVTEPQDAPARYPQDESSRVESIRLARQSLRSTG